LGLPDVFDRHLGRHGLHQGLSWGWIASIWLAHILTQSDHRKQERKIINTFSGDGNLSGYPLRIPNNRDLARIFSEQSVLRIILTSFFASLLTSRLLEESL